MEWRFWKRKKSPPADPLQVFDEAVDAFHARGVEVRKAAATLLALRADLSRQLERLNSQLGGLQERRQRAQAAADAPALQALEQDQSHTRRLIDAAQEGLARAEVDGNLLTQAARELRQQEEQLRAERTAAEARLRAGNARVQVGELIAPLAWTYAVKLEAARDELEKAHALAEIYRESHRSRE
jgi:phage shock protein A